MANYDFLLSPGKTKQMINSDLFADNVSVDSNLVVTQPAVKDLVRGRGDAYWKSYFNSLPKIVVDKTKAAFSIKIDSIINSLAEDDTNKNIFSETSQAITLIANKSLFNYKPGNPLKISSAYNPAYWKTFILGIPEMPVATLLPQPKTFAGKSTFNLSLEEEETIEVAEEHKTRSSNNNVVVETQAFSAAGSQYASREANNNADTGTETATESQPVVLPLQFSTSQDASSNSSTTSDATSHPRGLSGQFGTAQTQIAATDTSTTDDTQTRNANADRQAASRFAVNTGLPVGAVDVKDETKSPPAVFIKSVESDFVGIEPTIRPNEVYYDTSFELSVPYEKKTLDLINAPIGSMFIDVSPTYNFFVDNFETIQQRTAEQLLPNMYVFCTEIQSEGKDNKSIIFNQHITLSGKIPNSFTNVLNNKGEKLGNKDRSKYFDKYAYAFAEMIRLAPSRESDLIRKFTNLITPIENVDLFKDFNDKKELFPMFWDMSFTTDSSTQFAQVLEECQFYNILIKDIVENNLSQEMTEVQESISGLLSNGSASNSAVLKSWDLIEWINKIKETSFSTNLEDGVFLGKPTETTDLVSNPQFNLYKNLLSIIFIGKIKKIVENNLRTYQDLVSGKPAFSETIFYKIEKSDAATGAIIQNFYLPNSNKINIQRFIDTQVKYNKQYKIKIYAYQTVLGNKYHYQMDTLTDDTANIYFVNSPILKLIEVPFYEFVGRIMDNPPISPDVNICPYKGIDNQVLFNINGGIGRYKLDPIIIEPSDASIIEMLREAQRITTEELLEYKSDDWPSAFEIFRITKKPKSYKDFVGNRIALVQTDIDNITPQKATSASFVDDIIANRKYYYIFRTIDVHGHISNPTNVFEVELVNDGSIFPVIKTIDFQTNRDLLQDTKYFRSRVKIIPAFNQTIINEQKSGLIKDGARIDSCLDKEAIFLGTNDESVWGKLFKIRITSKRTGRKIDVNVGFSHKHVKNPN